jgi:MoaA/NifB/PqqE/SkfB family radical SAM enzyme
MENLKNPKIELPKFPRLAPPYRVHWNWEISYNCNYRCTYCDVWRKEEEEINRWKEIWDDIFEKYWCCHIRFSGGEPTVYPNFIDLVAMLLEKHTIDITTNLSFDIQYFVDNIKPEGVSISSSYHPESIEFKEFLDKVLFLKTNGYPITISYVAYPPNLKKMEKYKLMAEQEGIIFKIIPFKGKFGNQEYPQGYNNAEKKFLEDMARSSIFAVSNVRRQKCREREKITKGKLCRMGQMYAKIFPDGKVTRCCANMTVLGKIFDENFRLLDSPEPCDIESCVCFKGMFVGKEDIWLPLWEMPEHRIYKTEYIKKLVNSSFIQNSGYIEGDMHGING